MRPSYYSDLVIRRRLYAYVDETGDRGIRAQSSAFFAMAALVVPEEEDPTMRGIVADCRQMFRMPAGATVHWSEHLRKHPRRQYAATKFAELPGACLNYVLFEKAAIPATSGLRVDQAHFYNYTAWLTLQRILRTAADWPGGPRDVTVRFGHVKGVDPTQTGAYFDLKRKCTQRRLPWHLLQGAVTFPGTHGYDGLQAADMYAGMLKLAIIPDKECGGYEESHFMRIRHQIRRHKGRCWGAGFKVMARPETMPSLPWWQQADLG